MLTRQIDAAMYAMQTCGEHVPFLRDQYRPGSMERAALDDVLASLKRADAVLFSAAAEAPAEQG
jgi:hypothetical protein